MPQSRPPFRADMVGSLLRTAPLKAAREQHAAGTLDAAGLKAVEDQEISKIIARQEAIGLEGITDGEFRRAYWHFDFLEQLDGVTSVSGDSGMNFKGGVGVPKALRITGKVDYSGSHPMVDHFRFVKDNTTKTPKMTIPGPSMLHYRGGRKMMNTGLYPDMAEFYDDVGKAYAKAVTEMDENDERLNLLRSFLQITSAKLPQPDAQPPGPEATPSPAPQGRPMPPPVSEMLPQGGSQ